MDNLSKFNFTIDRSARNKRNGHASFVLWFTGLSGSGKSTISNLLEIQLHQQGIHTYVLDGDAIRMGLNKDLGFSASDRSENIRRSAELCKLFVDAGILVLATFISPFENDRALAREIIGSDNFVEIYLSTPLAVCRSRDPKGLYKKAEENEIKSFTGISSPYEAPKNPTITIDTSTEDAHDSVKRILTLIQNNQLKNE